ncbi:MAG TPA: Mur ligase domain-containing protein, partial [Chloroflexota bacterium]|nr:Mur ligase domain-containing protein [Chloroflexota bacterium]
MPELAQAQRVHLIGIGGSGMSALASLLLRMGKAVSGSDMQPGSVTERLRAEGAAIHSGHAAANVGDADYVVRSSAVGIDNPEVGEAQRKSVTTRKLAEAVGELMRGRSGVAVAGTHGKTTTTALVTWLLQWGGIDPLALIGGDLPAFPLGARAGEGPMVVEADEYDRRFLEYWPEVAVVTSVEADHLDYYRDLAEIQGAFQELIGRLPRHGRLVVCADDGCAMSLQTEAERQTYGFMPGAVWQLGDYAVVQGAGSRFTLTVDG